MNARQMHRMIEEHHISTIYDPSTGLWWAGDAQVGSTCTSWK